MIISNTHNPNYKDYAQTMTLLFLSSLYLSEEEVPRIKEAYIINEDTFVAIIERINF